MYYAISDLHGCFDKYAEMIKKIRLKDSDSLFIVGDIVDIGTESFKIIEDALMRCNVFPIIGDHDLKALKLLSKLGDEKAKSDPEFQKEFALWLKDGGTPTAQEFLALGDEEKQDAIDYLREESVLYDEVEASGVSFVLVHAGLKNFDPKRRLDDYGIEEMIYESTDFGKEYFKNKKIIVGHKPTFEIDESCRGLIYRNESEMQIGIDCGAVYGEHLGCLCLDTDEEFYV